MQTSPGTRHNFRTASGGPERALGCPRGEPDTRTLAATRRAGGRASSGMRPTPDFPTIRPAFERLALPIQTNFVEDAAAAPAKDA